ncbi:YciI family protein [Prauserella flavalba]|uniref:YciI family protein n=1 Tax=Prauserella flavalba TaxID=1477506 RepID=UPI0036E65561
MKYVLMIYSSPASWNALSQRERDRVGQEHAALGDELRESGEWVGGNALADPSCSVAVRVRDGVVTATDGPFAEVKEHIAGYYVVECETLGRAVEIAARMPDSTLSHVEVRPVMHPGGLEM